MLTLSAATPASVIRHDSTYLLATELTEHHSARSVASGLCRKTSRLDTTPITATRIAVRTTPATCSVTKIFHGISSAYLLTPHVSPIAPTDPMTPASDPSTPYSNSSMRPIVRVFAPSVLNTAAS